jgi:hypothetical protein
MIYFPETIDTISTMSLRIFTLSSWGYARELTLCMLSFWSHEGVVFLDFLPLPHLVTSFHLPCLRSTDAHFPRLGDPAPLPPKWRPFPQGPRTLPYWDSVQQEMFFLQNWNVTAISMHSGKNCWEIWNIMVKCRLHRMVKIFVSLEMCAILAISRTD